MNGEVDLLECLRKVRNNEAVAMEDALSKK